MIRFSLYCQKGSFFSAVISVWQHQLVMMGMEMVWLRENERGKRKRECWGDDSTQKYCYTLCVLIFPHSKVSRGGGFNFLHPWVSTFIVCHTTFLWAPFFLLSQGPFKDIILYKNTQLLSDGNAPWLWLSGCLGNSRQDVSQAFRRAEQIQGSDWWKKSGDLGWHLHWSLMGWCLESQFSACTPLYL